LSRFTDATASLSATRLDRDRKTPSRWSLYFFDSLPREMWQVQVRGGNSRTPP